MSDDSDEPYSVTLADIWAYYDSYNKSVNDITRQISYAGIALIWVFRVTVSGKIEIPRFLVVAGFCLVLCLFLDYLQYIIGSVAYHIYGNHKERTTSAGATFQQPRSLLLPMDIFFFSKIAAALIGYAFIMRYLLGVLF